MAGGESFFGSSDLAIKYGIVLGCLLGVVCMAGGIKLLYDKRKLKKHIAHAKRENVNNSIAIGKKVAPKTLETLEEGDLFGVRAIERGFYGGVAQSPRSSMVSSRSPSISGLPVQPAGPLSPQSETGRSPSQTPVTPKFQRPLLSPTLSTTSLHTKSPLSQNPITADDAPLHSSNALPIPPPSARIRGELSRPGTARSQVETPLPNPLQVDLPSPGFSPSLKIKYNPGEERGDSTPKSQSRPLSFSRPQSIKSYRSSKTINLDSVAIPSIPNQPTSDPGMRSRLDPKTPEQRPSLADVAASKPAESHTPSASVDSESSIDPFKGGSERISRASSASSEYSVEEFPFPKMSTPQAQVQIHSNAPINPLKSHPPTTAQAPTSRPNFSSRNSSLHTPIDSYELDSFQAKQRPVPQTYTPRKASLSSRRAPPAPLPLSKARPIDKALVPAPLSPSLQPPQTPTITLEPPKSAPPTKTTSSLLTTDTDTEPLPLQKNASKRLTTDALSDLYDSYWRRSRDDFTNDVAKIVPAPQVDEAMDTIIEVASPPTTPREVPGAVPWMPVSRPVAKKVVLRGGEGEVNRTR